MNGKARVFYSTDKTKGCWYGFVGKPVIKFNLEPVIGKDNKFSFKNVPKLREIIEDLVASKFNKYCLPNKRPLSIPITKLSNIHYPRIAKQKDKSTNTVSLSTQKIAVNDAAASNCPSRKSSFVSLVNHSGVTNT